MGILEEFEYLLNQWQISKGYTSRNTKLQLNRASESNNLKIPKHTPQAQSNIIIAKEKSRTLSNNQPVLVAKQVINMEPISINLQGRQISSPAVVIDETDELLTVPSNTTISKEKPHTRSNNQSVVLAKQATDIKSLPKNLQRRQISSQTVVADEVDELLIVLDSDDNSNISNAKRMKFDEDDEEKFVSYLNSTRNI